MGLCLTVFCFRANLRIDHGLVCILDIFVGSNDLTIDLAGFKSNDFLTLKNLFGESEGHRNCSRSILCSKGLLCRHFLTIYHDRFFRRFIDQGSLHGIGLPFGKSLISYRIDDGL